MAAAAAIAPACIVSPQAELAAVEMTDLVNDAAAVLHACMLQPARPCLFLLQLQPLPLSLQTAGRQAAAAS